MNPRILGLFLSWTQLTSEDQESFDAAVRTFLNFSNRDRLRKVEEIGRIVASIDVGPLKTPCPRCGR